MSGKHTKDKYLCSFCERNQDQVEILITGSTGNICNECIETCNEVIEDYSKRRKTIEVIEKITEPELVHLIMIEKKIFFDTLDFMLRGAFDLIGHIFISPNSVFDSLLIALEVPKDELQLSQFQAPGDIDMLIIPQNREHILYDKTMAIEVKVVRPTIIKPSRNANSLGETQINKLVNGGFPYVGLLHLIIPEPSPKYMLDEVTVKSIGLQKEMPLPPPRIEKFDLFPTDCAYRQLGRLRKLRIPDFVGFNPVDLSIRTSEEKDQTYVHIIGYGIQKGKRAKQNPNPSYELLEKVKEHVKNYNHRYLNLVCPYTAGNQHSSE